MDRLGVAFRNLTAPPGSTGIALILHPVVAQKGAFGQTLTFAGLDKGNIFRAGDRQIHAVAATRHDVAALEEGVFPQRCEIALSSVMDVDGDFPRVG